MSFVINIYSCTAKCPFEPFQKTTLDKKTGLLCLETHISVTIRLN
jgi:hypothetical protein